MQWLIDLANFLAVPFFLVVLALVFYHGNQPKRYKIVREFNQLGEERFEVWFDYPSSPLVRRTWRLRETFETLALAEEYLARQHLQRETVREGELQK